MYEKEEIINIIFETIRINDMVHKRDRVLVSVSGGPDSVLLLHALNILSRKLDIDLFAFTLDHGTRDGESTRDCVFVKELCKKLGIEVFSEEIDVKKYCTENVISFQEGARQIRRELLLEIAGKNHIEKIATGHNLTDSIETFFINLFRGSGLKGLSGILPVEGCFIRPLINIKKDEIESFLQQNGIDYCIDRTNLRDDYLRNKIRNRLIPLIKKDYCESLESVISNTMELIRQDQDYLYKKMTEVIKNTDIDAKTAKAGYFKTKVMKLLDLHTALKSRLILYMVKSLKGSTKDVCKENIYSAIDIIDSSIERKTVSIFKDLLAIKEGEHFYLLDISKKELFPDDIKDLIYSDGDSEVIIEESSLSTVRPLRLKTKDFSMILEILAARDLKTDMKTIEKNTAYIDRDKVVFPIKIRNWQKGDSFIPFGLDGYKKLSDFFNDIKLPLSKRKKVKIFLDDEKIIWIGGHRVDERVKIDEDTKDILSIKIYPG